MRLGVLCYLLVASAQGSPWRDVSATIASFNPLNSFLEEGHTCVAPTLDDSEGTYGWCREGKESFEPGTTCHPVCKPGYFATVSEMRCLESGFFDPPSFSCIGGNCHLVKSEGIMANGQMCEEHFAEGEMPSGSTCTVKCKDGFSPYPHNVTCSNTQLSAVNKCIRTEGACSVPGVFGPHIVGDPSGTPCTLSQRLNLGSSCDVKCASGWRPASSSHRSSYSCESASVPNAVAPTLTCEGIECTLPPLPELVVPALTGGCGATLAHGQSCSVRCQDGYQLKDPASITQYSCHAGALTPGALSVECEEKNCGQPSSRLLRNSPGISFSQDCATTFESTCTASCDAGYSGDSKTWTCNAAGEWTGTIPTCNPVYCPAVPLIPNMIPDPAGCNTFFPSTCKYSPAPGYNGSAVTLSCESNGQWKQNTETDVEPILCKANEHVVSHECVPCPPGETKVAGSSAAGKDNTCTACLPDTYRTAQMSECTACPKHSTTNKLFGAASKADCKCTPGYSGSLDESSNDDTCVACPANTFKDIVGSAECQPCPGTSVTDGLGGTTSRAGCKCGPGTTGDLATQQSCQDCPKDSFKPTSGSQACSSCPAFSTTNNKQGQADAGSCLCDVGYTGLVSNVNSTCTACRENHFKASIGPAACHACPPNSHTSLEGRSAIDACKCDTGFIGPIISSGSTCSPLVCDHKNLILGSGQVLSHSGTDIPFNTVVTVSCLPGHISAGSAGPFTCKGTGPDGFGDADTAGLTCTPIKCNAADLTLTPAQELVSDAIVDFSKSAVIKCKNGHRHNVPSLAIECNGIQAPYWETTSASALQCTPITCDGDLLKLQPNQVSLATGESELEFGSQASVECEKGYIPSGSTGPFVCGADGFSKADTSGLSCTAVTCRTADLELPQTHQFSLQEAVTAFNGAGTITCARGFRPTSDVQSLSVSCSELSTHGWSSFDIEDLPCEPISCDSSKLAVGSYQTTTLFDATVPFGRVGKVICKSGYKAKVGPTLLSEISIQCSGTGSNGFDDPAFDTLVCEDEDDCTEQLLWKKALPATTANIESEAGCTDGFARSRFNDPVSFCAWYCKIEDGCLDFFVYSKDSAHPSRCCTFTRATDPGEYSVEESGEFYAQTCPNKQPAKQESEEKKDETNNAEEEKPKWWEAKEDLAAPVCPAGRFGSITVGNDCFWMPSQPKSFDGAEADCVAQGGHLASIHSDAEQNAIKSLQTQCGAECRAYIGLTRPQGSPVWSWTDGSPREFNSWNEGCVDDQATVIGVHTNEAHWCGLGSGTEPQYYVCQKRPVEPVAEEPVPAPKEDAEPVTTKTLTDKNGKPTKDPGCSEKLVQSSKMANVVVGAITGCTNAYGATNDFENPKDHCAYLCSLDKSCNHFFVFSANYDVPGRCCLQESFSESSGFYSVDGDFYSQSCEKPKPEPDMSVYKKFIFKASDDQSSPPRAILFDPEATGEAPTVALGKFSTHKSSDYFRLTPAVNNKPGEISFMSALDANKFLRHNGQDLRVDAYGTGNSFADDASFILDAPLGSTSEGAFSFRSSNLNSHFIYHDDTSMRLAPVPSGTSALINAFKRSASFILDPVLEKTFDFVEKGTHTCRSSESFDDIKGDVSLETCRTSCSAGLRGCFDKCPDNYRGGGNLECNALEYNADTQTCTIFHKCVSSTAELGGSTKLEMTAYALPEPVARACTVCGANEVMQKECSANHDRKCVCKPGFAGLSGSCKEVSCPVNSTPNQDSTKCSCDPGYGGGPFLWKTTAYQSGSCFKVPCPAYSVQNPNNDKECQCNMGYLKEDGENSFAWDSEKSTWGSGTCQRSSCPQNAGGVSCLCIDGFLSNVPGAGQEGLFSSKGWQHTCEEQACPANSRLVVSEDGIRSCVCDEGHDGGITWKSNKGWQGSCMPVTCPDGYTQTAPGVCTCPAGFVGSRKWSTSSKTLVPEACTEVKCPSGSFANGRGGCDCDSTGTCSWNPATSNYDCTCKTSECPIPNSHKPDANGLCECKPGFSGTLTWDNDSDQLSGSCEFVSCPADAIGHPACECGTGYVPSVDAGIVWSAENQNYGTVTCKKVDCPANTDNSLHPACPCASGYKNVKDQAIGWDSKAKAWSGQCEAVHCPDDADGEPSCECKVGFKNNNVQINGTSYSGSCDLVDCPEGAGTVPSCQCPVGFKPHADDWKMLSEPGFSWDAQVGEWTHRCEPVSCGSGFTNADGTCGCPIGQTGECVWKAWSAADEEIGWKCSCSEKACPEHSTKPDGADLCQCTRYGTLSWNSDTNNYDGECSLMPWSHTNSQPICELRGAGNVATDMIAEGSVDFGLHGQDEWVVLSGPYAPVAQAHFQAQVTTVPWQQVHVNNVCTVQESSVVVFKDVALKCGSVEVLFVATPHVMNDGKPGCNHDVVKPKLLVRGSSAAGIFYNNEDILPSLADDSELALDGSKLYTVRNACKNGCSNENLSELLRVFEFGFFCGETGTDRDTEVRVAYECSESGGCYTKLSTQIPVHSSATELRDGTTAGGICGGWSSVVEEDLHAKHLECQKNDPLSFLSNSVCRSRFTTKDHNSLFKVWEERTHAGSLKYDAHKWQVGTFGTNPDNGEPERRKDQNRLDEMVTRCEALRRTVDSRASSALDKNVPVDNMLLNVAKVCAEDMYWSINWDARIMAESFCTPLNKKLALERADVSCAAARLGLETDVTSEVIQKLRKACPTCVPPRVEGVVLARELSEITNLVDEIESSLAAIERMSFPACAPYIDSSELSNLDCSNHAFRNTRTWSCGAPMPPPQAEFGNCKGHDLGDSCTATCKAAYTTESGRGTVTCEKVQGAGREGVDVSMAWSTPSLSCKACTTCGNTEFPASTCTASSDTQCVCAAGHVAKKGVCTPCDPGTFNNAANSTTCTSCPSGTFSLNQGSTECKQCAACSDSEVPDLECKSSRDRTCKCKRGYAGTPGACDKCSGGTYSDEDGLAVCKTCTACAHDEGKTELTSCQSNKDAVCQCRAGFAGDGTKCDACLAGKTYSREGQETCLSCTRCNTEFETQSVCLADRNSQCQCLDEKAKSGESCKVMRERLATTV